MKPLFDHSYGLSERADYNANRDAAAVRQWWEEFLHSHYEDLKPAIITVPKELQGLPLCFPGECFERAVQWMQIHPQIKSAEYIFGESSVGGGLNPRHGWVELNDMVFDGVLQEWYHKDAYYQIEFAHPWYRYDRPAALWCKRNMRHNEHSFYWHEWLLLPWGKNTPINLDKAREAYRQAKIYLKTHPEYA